MRQKHVFPTRELAHLWAHQTQDNARNSQDNFYFKGKTIYSYRDNYPIATLYKDIVFFRLDSYSNTTSKHIGHTRGAVSHMEKIYCHYVPTYSWSGEILNAANEANFDGWQETIEDLLDQLGNPRNRDIQGRLNKLFEEIRQVKVYAKILEISIPDKLQEFITLSESPELVERAKQAKSKKDNADAKRLEEAKQLFNEIYLPLWREYKHEELKDLSDDVKTKIHRYTIMPTSYTRLRYNTAKQRVETSKGVEIPKEVAYKAYLEIKDCIASYCDDLNIPVMNYTITKVDKDRLHAGCHMIPMDDVNYIANLLNW